jgi:hypothetical protein
VVVFFSPTGIQNRQLANSNINKMIESRLKQWMIAYISIEIIIFCATLAEIYVLHSENPILLSYLGLLIICFLSLGLIFAGTLIVLYYKKNISAGLLLKYLLFSLAGIILPFFFLFYILSQLH